jgi:hypothetical protein
MKKAKAKNTRTLSVSSRLPYLASNLPDWPITPPMFLNSSCVVVRVCEELAVKTHLLAVQTALNAKLRTKCFKGVGTSLGRFSQVSTDRKQMVRDISRSIGHALFILTQSAMEISY